MIIAISAGHYPDRPGACYANFCEHHEAVKWAIEITDCLIRENEQAVMVPTGFLREKVTFINDHNAVLAAEVHFNSFKIWEDANRDGVVTDDELRNAGDGCETLYYPGSEKGAIFADNIQQPLADLFGPNRGIKEGWYRMDPKNGPDFFLAKTDCPSVILEPEFIHHTNKIQEKRSEACKIIAKAIIKTKGEIYG